MTPRIGQRVYHRRSDLLGRVTSLERDRAFVKYEWPWDPNAAPEPVPIVELEEPPAETR